VEKERTRIERKGGKLREKKKRQRERERVL
jgi:hypothetical protein